MSIKEKLRQLLSPKRETAPADGVVRGRIDLPFLLLVLLMLVLGAAMSYSASAAYGQQFYGDSLYFFKRYILFAAISIIATAGSSV